MGSITRMNRNGRFVDEVFPKLGISFLKKGTILEVVDEVAAIQDGGSEDVRLFVRCKVKGTEEMVILQPENSVLFNSEDIDPVYYIKRDWDVKLSDKKLKKLYEDAELL